jgi:fatty-acyl-CoA synthase
MLQVPGLENYNLKSLRFLVSGGSPCPIPIIEGFSRFGVTFMQGYGMTETSPSALLLRAEDAVRKAGSVGKPFVHVEVKVVNDRKQRVKPGEVGEVLIRGKSVMKGYWKNPPATAAAIKDGWMHSGDLARVDEEGYLYIVDRKKDMIISGGENIYPAEVEQVLSQHPEVLEAAVIGVPDAKWGESVLALIVAKPGASPSAESLLEHCRRNLARYKCPRRAELVKELPRTPAGKVLKRVLREKYQ